MKYPIDEEKYIADMRETFGDHEGFEPAYRRIIPIINAAYLAGLERRPGYPIQFGEEARLEKNELARRILDWTNAAYELGREAAGRTVRA